jgi:hypothetical protein
MNEYDFNKTMVDKSIMCSLSKQLTYDILNLKNKKISNKSKHGIAIPKMA